jgi:hypothetical protein
VLKLPQGGKKIINSVKKAEKAEEAIKTSQGIIKDFKIDFLLKEKGKHIFSADYIKSRIMDLGNTRKAIMKSGLDIVEEMNEKGLIEEGATQIGTTINGLNRRLGFSLKMANL